MTKKLYDEDVYCAEFDASILNIKEKNGQFHVVLDQTAFYPEGGGQPSDMGNIDGYSVEYVYEKQREIYHVLSQKPQMGARVHCSLDWDRRFHFMQQHLGQHILSAVFVVHFNANTVGLRFGEETATIELDRHVTDSQANQTKLSRLQMPQFIKISLWKYFIRAWRKSFGPVKEKSLRRMKKSELLKLVSLTIHLVVVRIPL